MIMVESKTVVKRESSLFPIALLVTIGFIIAKWCGTISWPWLWVWAPLWITVGSYAALGVMVIFLAGILYVAEKVTE